MDYLGYDKRLKIGGINLKVYIIAEGSAEIGFGHLSRCTSLYQGFLEKGISPIFIINGDDTIKQLISNKKSILFDWVKESDKLFDEINGADIAIIDSYLANRSLYEKISQIVKIPIFIDDNLRLDYPLGIIINGSVFAKKLNYPDKQGMTYLLGSEYLMLKKEFWNVPAKNINKDLKKIMITFGGEDIRNLTPGILEKLINSFPNINKRVIIGRGFQNLKEIEKLIDKNCELIFYPATDEMINIMMESDIAISAGGQTLYELASIGVPAISVAVVENQQINAKTCAELGFNYYAGWWEDKKIYEKISNYVLKLKNMEIRKEMIELGQKFIKPDGTREIIDFLIKKVKD